MSNRTTSPATQTMHTGQSSTMMPTQGQGSTMTVPHEKIAARAYEKWCKRGCTDGAHQQDWLEAEAELRSEMMGGRGGAPTPMKSAGAQSMPAAMQKSAARK